MAWKRSKLTGLADFINGYAFKPADWGEDGLPIIRIEQLKDPEKIEDYYSGRLPEKNLIDNGDLVFSWSASLFLKIWEDGKAALNQHLFKVIERDGVSRPFLKYLIEYHLPELAKTAHGSTMQHITRKSLIAFEVSYPDTSDEQIAIETALGSIDQAIGQTEAIIAKERRILSGLRRELLAKGIDQVGRIRNERDDFKDSSFGRIPVTWHLEELADLTTVIVDGVHHTPNYVEHGVPFVTVRNLTNSPRIDFEDLNYVSHADHETFKRRAWPRPGDVLVTKDGTLGVARVVDTSAPEFSIFVSVALLRPNPERVLPDFLALFFETPEFEVQLGRLSAGTGLKHIHLEHFRQFLLRKPPIEEQKRIVERLKSVSSSIGARSDFLTKLHSLKRGVMHDLLTGKISTSLAQADHRLAVGAVA